MRITRVHTQQSLQLGLELQLETMPSAHLIRVLRLRAGAQVILFNGDGLDYVAEIIVPKVESVRLKVLSTQAAAAESPARIWLMQALCRGEKMDFVLEKATELGVHGFIPVLSERCEVQLDGERAEKRLGHWQRVISSACEQSGRAVLPKIVALQELQKCLAQPLPAAARFALHPGASNLLSQWRQNGEPTNEVIIAVGPEGGFSERDLTQLGLLNFRVAGLGPRVLRTETAGLAAISALQTLVGDFE